MSRNSRFSLSIKGTGPLLGMFVTEVQQHFRRATLLDHSVKANAFRGIESALGQSGRLAPGQNVINRKLTGNLARPTQADVTVSFESMGGSERVVVRGGQRQSSLSFNMVGSDMSAAEAFIREVLRTVEHFN